MKSYKTYFQIFFKRLVIGTDPNKLFSIRSAIDKQIPCLFLKVYALSSEIKLTEKNFYS